MRGLASNSLVFPGMNRSGCQLGDEDPPMVHVEAKRAGDAIGTRHRGAKAGTPKTSWDIAKAKKP